MAQPRSIPGFTLAGLSLSACWLRVVGHRTWPPLPCKAAKRLRRRAGSVICPLIPSSRAITQGLPSYRGNIRAGSCGSNAAHVGTIDDLLVFTGNTAIDGPGGTLAQSSPCSIRSASGLTTSSTLVFDTADLGAFSSQVTDIAAHELGHSLGTGTLWQRFGRWAAPWSAFPLRIRAAPARQAATGAKRRSRPS